MKSRSPKAPLPSEYEEQCVVIDWFDWNCHRWKLPPFALIAIPNANMLYAKARNRFAVGQMMKNQGVRAGAPDLILPVERLIERNLFSGLVIELKAQDGRKPTPEQDAMLKFFFDHNWVTAVPRGAAQAIDIIKDYLDGR